MSLRFVLRSLAGALVVLLISGGLLEASLRGAQLAGLFSSQPRVTTWTSFYRDENPAFGVWHPADASYHARSECFDVVYRSNSYGARDPERAERAAAPRVVVLGDSFVEGVGVEQGLRLTDVLEQRSGLEHLNFGTAANFSSIQEWQLYETLASRFDHDAVFLFAFPNNDFIENDPQRFLQPERYRPYLRRSDAGGYEVYYETTLEETRRRTERQLLWNRLYNSLYVYRVVAFFHAQYLMRLAQGPPTPYGYIGYEQFADADIERLLFTYRKIRDAAGGRPLFVFTIPRLNELLYFAGEAYPDRLPRILAEFAEREPGIEYVDLLPGFVDDWLASEHRFGDYFLPCDGHWSVLGNRIAAEVVLRAVGEELRALAPDRSAERRVE